MGFSIGLSPILFLQNGPEHPRHLFVLLHQTGEKIGGAGVAKLLVAAAFLSQLNV